MKLIFFAALFCLISTAQAASTPPLTPLKRNEISAITAPSSIGAELARRKLGSSFTGRAHFADQSRALQNLVDRLMVRILTSPLGRETFKHSLTRQNEAMRRQFGVSNQAAEVILRQAPNPDGLYLGVKERRYLFVYSKAAQSYTGWSDPSGVTVLFLGPSDLNEEKLLSLLIHETAAYLDGYFVEAQELQRSFEDSSLISRITLNQPAIRNAILSLRAFRFEAQMLRSLGLTEAARAVPQPARWDETSCMAMLKNIARSLTRINYTAMREETQHASLDDYLYEFEKREICLKASKYRSLPGLEFGGPRPRLDGGLLEERN